jgi:ElaB/YqjD/DUF883 family membrane-anchored ribosome-binding protein
MSQADLNALERNVEQARARFANDLARLRSPVNLARFKDELWAEARETKDELVEKTKEAAKDGAQRVLTQLTERVAANPAAALAIGAGLAWRLFHRPPIATLLVGMGLVGLLRTSPSQHSSQPYMGLHDEDPKPRYRNDAGDASLATFTDVAKEKVQDWSAQASEVVRQTGTQIADKTASVADRASATLHDAGDAARDTMTQIADKAVSVAERASHRLRDTIPDQDDRDTYLLGAAALAVAAAVGIAYHRRAQEDTRPRGP